MQFKVEIVARGEGLSIKMTKVSLIPLADITKMQIDLKLIFLSIQINTLSIKVLDNISDFFRRSTNRSSSSELSRMLCQKHQQDFWTND